MKSTMKPGIQFFWAICSVLFWAAAAAGQDFTFKVPVELHKINPNITNGNVAVVLYTKDWAPKRMVPSAESQLAQSSFIARGYKDFALVNGEFAGTVTVPINVPPNVPGKSAADAFYYVIGLNLWDTVLNRNGTDEMENGTYGYDQLQPFVIWASGQIQQTTPEQVSQQTQGRDTGKLVGAINQIPARPPAQRGELIRKISNFQVMSRSGLSLTFMVSYVVPPGQGNELTLGAVALAQGQPSPLISCREIKAGPGNGSARLTLTATAKGQWKTLHTDQVRVFLKSSGKEAAVAIFDCPMTWFVERK